MAYQEHNRVVLGSNLGEDIQFNNIGIVSSGHISWTL